MMKNAKLLYSNGTWGKYVAFTHMRVASQLGVDVYIGESPDYPLFFIGPGNGYLFGLDAPSDPSSASVDIYGWSSVGMEGEMSATDRQYVLSRRMKIELRSVSYNSTYERWSRS